MGGFVLFWHNGLGFCPRGVLSQRGFVLEGFCPEGFCPRGFCPRGVLSYTRAVRVLITGETGKGFKPCVGLPQACPLSPDFSILSRDHHNRSLVE